MDTSSSTAIASEGGGEDKMPHSAMEYIINHVILPPQLPKQSDYRITHASWLINRALVAMKLFHSIWESDETRDTAPAEIQRAFEMLNNLTTHLQLHRGFELIQTEEI
ncbi:hypothetical protein RRF57_001481 [Xylaria bambusicola]|uniref:DUF6606 domain-containing protein n=1 Tax=Xylaria bambusicola TaxID=326684 RepID=A0AAN7U5J2_9PEZI